MKVLLGIIIFFVNNVGAQFYTASWTAVGYPQYEVQQTIDTSYWNTIGTIAGKDVPYDYTFNVPGPTFYYRIKAGNNATKAVLVSEVLSIKPDKGRPVKTRIQKMSISVSVDSRLHYRIQSPSLQQVQYSLYDVMGRNLSSKTVNLHQGNNDFYSEKPSINGIYYGQFTGYFKSVTTKIFNY